MRARIVSMAMTRALEDSTTHQPRARVALSAALDAGPSHAYLFRGPHGAGKRAAARAFAAEILAAGAADPEDARRRALLDPSPHPDLVWLAPTGAQHLVEAVRERVISAAAYRPFEGDQPRLRPRGGRGDARREPERSAEDARGAAEFVHLILLSAEPAALLETISSRCQPVDFAPLPAEALERLSSKVNPAEVAAAARLAAGDLERARFLLSAPVASSGRRRPAAGLPDDPARPGGSCSPGPSRPAPRSRQTFARRSRRRRRRASSARPRRWPTRPSGRAGGVEPRCWTSASASARLWLRDLAATALGAEEAVFNRDRLEALRAAVSDGLEPAAARRAAELVQDTRRRLDLNVSEELALEALCFRLQRELG